MAEVTQNVIIDFSVDYTELTNAQEQLAKSGKVDATQFTALNKSLKTTALDTKGLIQEFKNVGATATKMGKSVEAAFGAGVQDALDEAGVSVDEFKEALVKANEPTKRLKTQLLELKEALAQAKLNGKDTGVEFEALRKKAGEMEDAIRDAGAEIKNAGSDTRNIDNVVGSISALAGAFAAVQGAAALFGDENEDLQKALLKVNAALALSSGLQQFANATTKEGALTKLADTIATGGQTVALKLYTFVTGGATLATKLLRAALIATGIGAIVFLLLQAATAMGLFKDSSEDATKATEDLNDALDRQKEKFDALNNRIDVAGKLRREKLKQQGADDNKIFADELADRNKIIANSGKEENRLFQLIADKNTEIEAIAKKLKDGLTFDATGKDRREMKKKMDEDLSLLKKSLAAQQTITEDAKDKRDQTIAETTTKNILDAKKAAEDAAKDAAKRASDQKAKNLAEKKADDARTLQDELAALERKLLAVEKNSQAEVDIQKDIVAQKAKIDLNAEKLKVNQIALIKERSLADQLTLQEEFNKKATTAELQSQIDTTNALLAGIGLTNEKKLQLQIENITTTSQLEINAAEGNSAKILLIEAKRISDIRALKIAAIDAERAEQIASTQKTNDIVKTALEKVSQDRVQAIETRIAAIKGIESQEKLSNQNQIDDLRRKFDERLISLKDYQDKAAVLNQNAADIEQKSLDDQEKARKDDKDKRIEDLKEIAEVTIQVARQVADFFSSLSSLATAQDQQRIELQKRQLQSLVEAGAITEKEAKIRAQQIEILERQAKNRQAQREKQIAVFNALLAIPQAVLAGLRQGGPILAAIYGALAAAQAALVISRPVPKFFRGKKGKYEGPGSVAEIGSELVERNGRMFLYTKPTQTYLGAMDKVYTHAETRQILHNTNINTTLPAAKQEKFDYERLAKSIPKSTFSVNIDKDFIEESVNNGLQINKYFDKRYKF